jgi:hypothetical protein
MNARYRLARLRLQQRLRRVRPRDPEMLRLLQSAAAIARPRLEPDPSARPAGTASSSTRSRSDRRSGP